MEDFSLLEEGVLRIIVRGPRGSKGRESHQMEVSAKMGLEEFLSQIGKLCGVKSSRVVLRRGDTFPPVLLGPLGSWNEVERAHFLAKTLLEVGIRDKSCLLVSRASVDGDVARDVKCSEPKKPKKRSMPGLGRRLGRKGEVPVALAEKSPQQRLVEELTKEVTAMEALRATAGMDLAIAAGGWTLAKESGMGKAQYARLRKGMKIKRNERDEQQRAERRVAATLANAITFTILPGRLGVKYPTDSRGRKMESEVVDALSEETLKAVLCDVAETDMESLRPHNIAETSPRVFWALVRHGAVDGKNITFADALHLFVPGANWQGFNKRIKREIDKEGFLIGEAALEEEKEFIGPPE